MELQQKGIQQLRFPYQLIAILCGAFLTGSLWRIRGDSGYGAMWGMFVVACGLTAYIFFLFPNRRKLSYTMFPVIVLLTAITVGGWGTLNTQMGGYLTSAGVVSAQTVFHTVPVSPWSGLIIMLCLGFGWMPLFALLIGCSFSEKKHGLKPLVIAVLLFQAVFFLSKATVAHPLFQFVGQDATALFREGLAQVGITDSPYLVYLKHFDSDVFAKTIPFGRNYFTSVEQVSSVLATCSVLLYLRFGMKDKRAARLAFGINCIAAAAITLADAALVCGSDRSIMKSAFLVKLFGEHGDWSAWEFGTGFFIGFGVITLLLSLSPKKLAQSNDVKPMIPSLGGSIGFVYHTFFTLFAAFGVTTLRPLIGRIFLSQEHGDFGESTAITLTVLAVLLGLAFLGFLIHAMRKNILIGALRAPSTLPPYRFFGLCLIGYYFVHQLIYGFIGQNHYLKTPLPWMAQLMICSGAVVLLCLLLLRRMQKKPA